MATVIDLTGNTIKADVFEGTTTSTVNGENVNVSAVTSTAGTSSVTADDLEAVIKQILDLIDGKADAA